MIICSDLDALRQWRAARTGRVGFVPTMGALHEGHLSLMREAAARCEHVLVSVFVNPTQFGPHEDLEAYPRDLEADAALCRRVPGVEAIFAPSVAQIYPEGDSTLVRVQGLDQGLCGPHRPGHFQGVATVVAKLLIAARADVAVFGQKDYQQLAIIRRLAQDLLLPTQIIGAPTVREPGGLAMSSRNRYLSPAQRVAAQSLSRGLALAHQAWSLGQRDPSLLEALAADAITQAGLALDYAEAVHPDTLARLSAGPDQPSPSACVLAVAARHGAARLIDNLRLDGPLPAALLTHLEGSP